MEQQTKTILEMLAPLANKLGDTAAHLYYIYTRQIFAEGVAWLVTFVIVCAFIVFLALKVIKPLIIKLYRITRDEDLKGESAGGGVFMLLCVAMVISLPLCAYALSMVSPFIGNPLSDIPTNITKVVNPEYYAVDRILAQVKGLSK